MPRKSHRVGPAIVSDGTGTIAYRAVTDLVCVQCGRAINADELFSRRAQHAPTGAIGLKTAPICVACRPLHMEEIAAAPMEGVDG